MTKHILKLKNIGKIKEAELDISGLCVIAGKNDEGKSTAGKAVMALIKADNMGDKKNKAEREYFNRLISLLFDNDISQNGFIVFKANNEEIRVEIKNNRCEKFENKLKYKSFFDCTFIQSPIVWDLAEFFSSIKTLEVENTFYREELSIKYPYVLWDLYKKLNIPRQHKTNNFKTILQSLGKTMKGEFIKKNDKFYFMRGSDDRGLSKIHIKNLAMGIKSFGIIQLLLENKYMTDKGFFIIDEPENHLHPTWQTEFAKIIVDFVKHNIPFLINTHSPYMLEALYKYGKKAKINQAFYLAEYNTIKQQGNNEATLEQIYTRLNESFAIFDKLDDESNNG